MSIYEEKRRDAKSALKDIIRDVKSGLKDTGKDALRGSIEIRNDESFDDIDGEPAGKLMDGFLQSVEAADGFLQGAESILLNAAVQLGKIGLSHLVYLLKQRPISFETFLRFTGMHFDNLIPETCKVENVRYIGGKLRFLPDGEEAAQVEAELFFISPEKQWLTKECSSSLSPGQLTDWDTNPELEPLRNGMVLEYPIEAPTAE